MMQHTYAFDVNWMGKHDRMLCWGCLFYLFPLIFGEREREKETNREKREDCQRMEKRERVGEGSDSGATSKA